MQSEWLHIGNKKQLTRMVLIKAQRNDVNDIAELFHAYDKLKKDLTVYPWNQYVGLNDNQKWTIAE
jgi:hypothetical protein